MNEKKSKDSKLIIEMVIVGVVLAVVVFLFMSGQATDADSAAAAANARLPLGDVFSDFLNKCF